MLRSQSASSISLLPTSTSFTDLNSAQHSPLLQSLHRHRTLTRTIILLLSLVFVGLLVAVLLFGHGGSANVTENPQFARTNSQASRSTQSLELSEPPTPNDRQPQHMQPTPAPAPPLPMPPTEPAPHDPNEPIHSHWVDLGPPLSRQSLGAATWSLLHQMAAMYPTKPTAHQQHDMKQFISNLAQFYPCAMCAEHFRLMLHATPPQTQSRDALARWMCERHNEVNVRLEKPTVDCYRVHAIWPSELRQCGCDADSVEDSAKAIADLDAVR